MNAVVHDYGKDPSTSWPRDAGSISVRVNEHRLDPAAFRLLQVFERTCLRSMDPRVTKVTFVGAVGGLAGCIAMNLVSYLWAGAKSPPVRLLVEHGTRPDVASAPADRSAGEIDTATAKLAKRIAQPLLDRKLSREEQDQGGKVIHYGYGASVGAIYGVIGERLDLHDVRTGLLFGLCLWAGGVLIGLPAFKLASRPRAYTLSEHTFGVVGHLAYGLVLSKTYRVLDQP